MNLENLVLNHTLGGSPTYTLKLRKDKEPQRGDVVRSVFHRRDLHTLVFHVLSGGREYGYCINFHIEDGSVLPDFRFLCARRGTRVSWERAKEEKKERIRDTAKKLLPLYYNLNLGDYVPHNKGFLRLKEYLKALS